jgi:demethylmenaquinone methyltransferase/2-methoxy-6-polyprenyl-1,4-benzoquinol methylase
MGSTEAGKRIWQTTGAEKRTAIQRMFGEVAPTYDRLNGLMSLYLHRKWRTLAVKALALRPGGRALDVCCGTGDFLPPLRDALGSKGLVYGIDFCAPMLAEARKKFPDYGLCLADACRLPIRDASFEGVTVGWGIRNVPDVDAAHREIWRVLTPGGRFVSIDMARPRNPLVAKMSRWAFHGLAPLLGRLFGKAEAYTYLPESTDVFLSREQLADSMRKAGFSDIRCNDLLFGNICVHWGAKT